MPSLACNGASAGSLGSPEGSKAKTDPEKKFNCGICGQAFRTKSYLNKHQHRVHKAQKAQGVSVSGLNELTPSLTSPFSPQQNMSLLESFGFQIVQSAFASSLVDAEEGHSGIDFGGKWHICWSFLQILSFLGQSRVAHRRCSVFGNNFASRLLFLFVTLLNVYPTFLSQTAIRFLLFLLFPEYEKCVYGVFFFIKKWHEGFISFIWCRFVEVMFGMLLFVFWLVCYWVFLAAQTFLDMSWIIYCNLKTSNYLLSVSEFCIYVLDVF